MEEVPVSGESGLMRPCGGSPDRSLGSVRVGSDYSPWSVHGMAEGVPGVGVAAGVIRVSGTVAVAVVWGASGSITVGATCRVGIYHDICHGKESADYVSIGRGQGERISVSRVQGRSTDDDDRWMYDGR